MEHISILRHKAKMRQVIVVPGKHGMAALMLALKDEKKKADDIPVYMHQG